MSQHMAELEATASLPRPESSQLQLAQSPEPAPPAVEEISRSGPTPEGLETIPDVPSPTTLVVPAAEVAAHTPTPQSDNPPAAATLPPSQSTTDSAMTDDKTTLAETRPVSSEHFDSTPEPSAPLVPAATSATTTPTTAGSLSTHAVVDHTQATGGASGSTSTSAPHKRFTAVNVNRKFLEKSATSSAPAAPPPTGTKPGGPNASSQPPPAHSRLVTKKLTSLAQAPHPSSTVWRSAGSGSSAQSSIGGTPVLENATIPLLLGGGPKPASTLNASSSSAAAAQKSANDAAKTAAAWGGARTASASAAIVVPAGATVDFPTAAEAANGKKAKLEAAASAASQHVIEAAALKLQQSAAADAFRGVHLDPNTHHWDEDGDDDDFLNEVIDFGDGRQYTIHPETSEEREREPEQPPPPVRKEDRFGDDIGRHWPPERHASTTRAAAPSPTPSSLHLHGPGHDHRPPAENGSSSRTLFNERSNRFENAGHYRGTGANANANANAEPSSSSSNNSGPGPRQFAPAPPAGAWGRRDSHPESQGGGGRWQQQHDRQTSTSGASSGGGNMQMLRRPSTSTHDGEVSTSPTFMTSRVSSESFTIAPNGPSRSRGPSSTDYVADTRFSRGDARSDGHPSAPSSVRDRSRDSVRDLPPHMRGTMPPPSSTPPNNVNVRRPSQGARDIPPPLAPLHKTGSPSFASATTTTSPISVPLRSPAISLTSPRLSHLGPTPLPHGHVPPHDPLSLKPITSADVAGFSKDAMHTAAERARERRKAEEEQREKDKERARHKAAELAAAAEAKAAEAKRAAEKAAEEAAAVKAAAEAAAAAEALIKEEAAKLEREQQRAKAEALEKERAAAAAKAKAAAAIPPSVPHPPPSAEQGPGGSLWRVRSSRGSKRGADSKGVPPSAPRPGPREEPSTSSTAAPSGATATHSRPLQTPHARGSSWASVVKDKTEGTEPEHSVSSVGGDSWRAKPTPARTLPPSVGPSTLPTVHDVSAEEHDSLETIDFSDMGKLVGADEETTDATTPELPSPSPTNAPFELPPRPSQDARFQFPAQKHYEPTRPTPISPPSSQERVPTPLPSASSKGVGMSSPAVSAQGLMSPQALANLPLPPSKQHFRESSMSALEDVMSRIKGALSEMHPGESASAIDLALAASIAARKAVVDETFATTRPSRPASPPAHLPRPRVRIRKAYPPKHLEPINKRLLHLYNLPPRPVRLDILSWEPPIEGMSRRTLSRDELHFSPATGRVVVSLPSSTAKGITSTQSLSSTRVPHTPLPRVNLPSASRLTSRPPSKAETRVSGTDALSTMSRSPPPESPSRRASLSLPRSGSLQQPSVAELLHSTPPTTSSSSSSTRGKPSPKIHIGPDGVAFYRRHGATDSTSSLVTFTVTSELEANGAVPAPVEEETFQQKSAEVAQPAEILHSSSRPVTPPPKPTPWAKSPLVYHALDSSSRNVAADPENIKSLWETNEKDVVTIENSLEGIVDEPPSFSIQDMKSDDGEDAKAFKAPDIPSPPTSTAPTAPKRLRMYDAHRAFQQVPPSNGNETSSSDSLEAKIPGPRHPPPQPHTSRPHQTFSPAPGPTLYPQQPFAVSPIGQRPPPPPNGHAVQQPPSHMWMQVNPTLGPMPAYYRTPPYGQPVLYSSPSSLQPSPYSPNPPHALPKPMNGTPPRGTPPGTITPQQLLSPASAPTPMPAYMSGRATPSFYTPGVQQAQLPMVYPSSPGQIYSAPPPSASPGPTLYTSTPHGPYRPPTW